MHMRYCYKKKDDFEHAQRRVSYSAFQTDMRGHGLCSVVQLKFTDLHKNLEEREKLVQLKDEIQAILIIIKWS